MKVVGQSEVRLPTGEDDKREWSYTLIKLEEGDDVYQARHNNRWTELDKIKIADLEIEPSLIPRENLRPLYQEQLTKTPHPLPDEYNEKRS